MGKWDKLRGKVPPGSPLRDDKPGFEDLVAGHRVASAGKGDEELIGLLADAKKRLEEADAKWTDAKAEVEALGRMLIESFDAKDYRNVRTSHGLVKTNVEPFCSVRDREAFEAFLASVPELDYLWSVNWQALNSYVKGLLEEGKVDIDENGVMTPLEGCKAPPGVSVFLKTKINITK